MPTGKYTGKKVLIGGKWKYAYVNEDGVAEVWADTWDELSDKYADEYGMAKVYTRPKATSTTPTTPLGSTEPVDTDAAIGEGLKDPWTPAHDKDAPLGPGHDYTPVAGPEAPTVPTPAPLVATPSAPSPAPAPTPKAPSKKKYRYYWNDPEWKEKHKYGGSGEWLYGEAPAFGSPGYDGPLEPWKERGTPTAPRRPGRRASPSGGPTAPYRSPRRWR